MGNLGGGEILVILLVALIVLGPTRLPTAVRQVGRFVGELRRIGQGFQQELREAAEPLRETTATLKEAQKEVRDTAATSAKEAKSALKAADPRSLIEPPAAAEPRSPAANTGTTDTADTGADAPSTDTDTGPTVTDPSGKPD